VPQLVPQNELNHNVLEDRARLSLEFISEMIMEELCQEVADRIDIQLI
jgi:hypothetical protein